MNLNSDSRYCYAARCTWFGPIQEVGSVTGGTAPLPCCPHCHSMLFEMDSEATWWKGVDQFEAAGHPGYRAMLEWQRAQKRCFRTIDELSRAYKAATNIEVSVG